MQGHRSDQPRPVRAGRGGCPRGACQAGRRHGDAGDEATTADPYWNEDEAAHAGETREQWRRPWARRLWSATGRYRGSERRPGTRQGRACLLPRAEIAAPAGAGEEAVRAVGQGMDGGPFSHPDFARSGAASPIAGGAGTSLGPATGQPGGPLPDDMVLVNGQPEHLRDLTGPGQYVVVLALIPPACKCLHDLRQLTLQAQHGGAETYLIGVRGEDVSQLSTQVGLGIAHAVVDTGDGLH